MAILSGAPQRYGLPLGTFEGDPDGADSALRTVQVSSTGKFIADDTHSRIHQGRIFSIDSVTPGFDPSIAIGGTLDVVIIANAGNYPHAHFSVKLEGQGRFLVYELENNAAVSGGTALVASNKKWDSAQTFDGTAYRNPTVSLTNAVFKEGCLMQGSEGVGQTRTGAAASFDDEVIIQPAKPLLVRLLNEAVGTVRGCICVTIYNSVQFSES